MGVYNPLGKMPYSCDACDNWRRERCDLYHDKFREARHPDCPLVEVEPHGMKLAKMEVQGQSWKGR